MVKKLKAMAQKKASNPAGLLDSQLAQTIRDSAQQIWLAGMGAFSKAQAEGTQAFDKLIKEGVSLQKKTQSAAEERIGAATAKMTAMAGEVGAKANAQWDKLEAIFEQRTAKAMSRLGVPTARDVAALTSRVDQLAAAVAKLGGKVTPARKASARKVTPLKTARKVARKVGAKSVAKPAAAARKAA
ncbi:MAG: phasin family protein [Burkholderiaceae bacterium]